MTFLLSLLILSLLSLLLFSLLLLLLGTVLYSDGVVAINSWPTFLNLTLNISELFMLLLLLLMLLLLYLKAS